MATKRDGVSVSAGGPKSRRLPAVFPRLSVCENTRAAAGRLRSGSGERAGGKNMAAGLSHLCTAFLFPRHFFDKMQEILIKQGKRIDFPAALCYD